MSYESGQRMKRIASGKRIMGYSLNINENQNNYDFILKNNQRHEDYEKKNGIKIIYNSFQKEINTNIPLAINNIIPTNLFNSSNKGSNINNFRNPINNLCKKNEDKNKIKQEKYRIKYINNYNGLDTNKNIKSKEQSTNIFDIDTNQALDKGYINKNSNISNRNNSNFFNLDTNRALNEGFVSKIKNENIIENSINNINTNEKLFKNKNFNNNENNIYRNKDNIDINLTSENVNNFKNNAELDKKINFLNNGFNIDPQVAYKNTNNQNSLKNFGDTIQFLPNNLNNIQTKYWVNDLIYDKQNQCQLNKFDNNFFSNNTNNNINQNMCFRNFPINNNNNQKNYNFIGNFKVY